MMSKTSDKDLWRPKIMKLIDEVLFSPQFHPQCLYVFYHRHQNIFCFHHNKKQYHNNQLSITFSLWCVYKQAIKQT